jgi:transcriptional regulator with XRE-family HTH domain
MSRQRIREDMRRNFSDPEYRHAYADEQRLTRLSSQLYYLRKQRGWSRAELAERAGLSEATISRLESGNYERWSIRTLKRLAEALDLRLTVSFEAFGTLVREMAECAPKYLERPSFDDDPEFADAR